MSSTTTLNLIVSTLEETHERLIALIAKRALQGATGTNNGALQQQLTEIAALQKQANALLAKPVITPDSVERFLADAWRIGVGYADRDIELAARGLQLPDTPAPPIPRSPRQLVALSVDTNKAVNGIRLPLLRSTMDGYRMVVSDTARLMAAGSMSLGEAVRESTYRLARHGLGAFTDKAGRSWRPETYAEMALRTAYTNSANQARLDRYTDRGKNLVIVSDASPECEKCRPWEGKILAIESGPTEVPVAGTVSDATSAGLLHPRCRHSLNLYTPGLTQAAPPTAEPERYEQVQAFNRQRNARRVIRREIAAAQALRDSERVRVLREKLKTIPVPTVPPAFPPPAD